jgi:predicted nucleotidyltransferase
MPDNITTEDIIRLRNIKVFPVCIDCNEEEKRILQHVYPIMQSYVQQIIRSTFPDVTKIILFGSSITMKCNIESDLDIAIQTNIYDLRVFHAVREMIERMIPIKCDVLYYNDIAQGDQLLTEVNTGLVIKETSYEKSTIN